VLLTRPIQSDVAYGAFSFTSRVRVDARADLVSLIILRPSSGLLGFGLFGFGHPGFVSSGFIPCSSAECSMSSLLKFFSSTIGTKVLIGLTGLAFFGFLVTHLAGNLLVLFDREAFNAYSHKLISNPLIYIAELGLLVIFVVHAWKAVMVTIKNKRARPSAYAQKKWAGGASRKTMSSTSMIVTGLTILLFIIIHLKHFKFGTYYTEATTGYRDLAQLVLETFVSPIWVAWYVLVMVLIGMHLRHGISSAFQSLGLEHPRYSGFVRAAGVVLAILMAGGFALIPIYIFVTGGRS
jgi:succinate dehydrogenase / fumarate reductase cytochrome b subunit